MTLHTDKAIARIAMLNGFGDVMECDLVLSRDKLFAVHSHGSHSLGLPPMVDKNEALWYLKFHPSCRKRFKILATY